MAAASSYYFLLGAIPGIILGIQFIGPYLNSKQEEFSRVLPLILEFFPVGQERLLKDSLTFLNNLLRHQHSTHLSLLAACFLFTLTFVNSLSNGLYLLTGDRKQVGWTRHLKGLVLIFICIVFLFAIIVIPDLILLVKKGLEAFHPQGQGLAQQVIVQLVGPTANGLGAILRFLRSPWFRWPIFACFFSFLYQWFFMFRPSWKFTMGVGSAMISVILLGKIILWPLFLAMRDHASGGFLTSFYALATLMIWPHLLMCLFFFGASLIHESLRPEFRQHF